MSVLSSRGAGASRAAELTAAATATTESGLADADLGAASGALSGPVMFCVRDARAAEVSILHGDAEVIVRDRQLVDRILRAAQRATV
jgi:hypothetical protein